MTNGTIVHQKFSYWRWFAAGLVWICLHVEVWPLLRGICLFVNCRHADGPNGAASWNSYADGASSRVSFVCGILFWVWHRCQFCIATFLIICQCCLASTRTHKGEGMKGESAKKQLMFFFSSALGLCFNRSISEAWTVMYYEPWGA